VSNGAGLHDPPPQGLTPECHCRHSTVRLALAVDALSAIPVPAMTPSKPMVVSRRCHDRHHPAVGHPRCSSPLFWLSLLLISSLPSLLPAAELANLRVLFVTDDRIPGRTAAFTTWLKPLVKSVEVVTFSLTKTPAKEVFTAADVVLLDWETSSAHDESHDPWTEQAARFPNPLGAREAWSTPTVLLGYAGLMASITWRVAGQNGCGCLEPVAYDLRDHPITRGPLPIDRSATMEIPTPSDFKPKDSTATIKVLPFAPWPATAEYTAGWCSYLYAVSKMPDVEWISGGLNHVSITAAGIWRQGNLLHFGFQQSPDELNQLGRNLLANSIVYIADFHQDLPIAHERVGAQGVTELYSRQGIARMIHRREHDGNIAHYIMDMIAKGERERVLAFQHDDVAIEQWIRERLPYLSSLDDNAVLSVDEQLLQAHVTYDSPEFLTLSQELLRSEHPELAKRLLAAYLPECPQTLSPADQAKWIQTHVHVLFADDLSSYRWYVDPLAIARGKSSAECHGPDRRDRLGPFCDPKTGACKLP